MLRTPIYRDTPGDIRIYYLLCRICPDPVIFKAYNKLIIAYECSELVAPIIVSYDIIDVITIFAARIYLFIAI
jgi:hypothetical protein